MYHFQLYEAEFIVICFPNILSYKLVSLSRHHAMHSMCLSKAELNKGCPPHLTIASNNMNTLDSFYTACDDIFHTLFSLTRSWKQHYG
jgi:hypothetical protein